MIGDGVWVMGGGRYRAGGLVGGLVGWWVGWWVAGWLVSRLGGLPWLVVW